MKKEKPNWKIPFLLLIFIVPLFLTSFSQSAGNQQIAKTDSKKNCMLEVLESLENGTEYSKSENWGETKYPGIDIPELSIPDFDDFEFDIDFPELNLEDFDIEGFERKMEYLEKRIEEKMEEMIKRFESIQKKYEKRL